MAYALTSKIGREKKKKAGGGVGNSLQPRNVLKEGEREGGPKNSSAVVHGRKGKRTRGARTALC